MGNAVKQVHVRIEDAAHEAARGAGLEAAPIDHFLRSGEEAWEGSGSEHFTRAQFQEDMAYTGAVKSALRLLFNSLAELLPEEIRASAPIPADVIGNRIEPMVIGLLPQAWRAVAMREILAHLFVLNFPGAQAALDAKLSTCDLNGAWRVLWLMFEDYGLKPEEVAVDCEGMASDYAHVRWSAFEGKDPFSDVVVHEAAHMLHYLKPAHFDLAVRRGQERFVDVEFRHRELFAYSCEAYSRVVARGGRKDRMAFAATMLKGASSFPRAELDASAPLVLQAAESRSSWRVIREAVEIRNPRRGSRSMPT